MDKIANNQTLKIGDVDASLNYGKIYSGKKWTVIVAISFSLSILVILFALIGLFYPPYDESKFMIIAGSLFGCFMTLVTLLIYLFVNHGKKRASLWLKDAVVVKANAILLDARTEVRFPIFSAKAAAIRVKFCYDGLQYVRESTHKSKRLYLAVFNKYADRTIKIAYSPKYDQVMLLKSDT